MCLWKLKSHLGYHRRAWSSPVWLDQVINKTQVSYCLCLPNAGIKITWHHTQLCMWAMRIKLWLHADRAPHPSLYVGNRGQTVTPCLQSTTPSSYVGNGDQIVTPCLQSKHFAKWAILTASSVTCFSLQYLRLLMNKFSLSKPPVHHMAQDPQSEGKWSSLTEHVRPQIWGVSYYLNDL